MGMFESTYPVWGSATPCKILFIGEAPGEVEDRNKKPFTGASGTLLQKILNEEGVSEYGFTNLVKCFPKDKKVDAKALKICGDYLREDLKRCSPNVVVALGKAVYSHLSGKSRSIQQVRGTVFYSQEFGVKVVPMIHPSAIFKTPGCEALIRQDLKRVVKESQTRELGKIVGNYVVLSDFESFQKFKQEIEQCQEFAFDIETDSTDFINGHILGIGFSFRPNEGYYIGLLDRGKKVWSGDEEQAIWQFLRDIFSSDKSKVGQNCLQGEVKVLMADGTKKKISEIVNKKITTPVLSYNESTGKVEPKRITGWFKESDKTVKWKKLITENSIDGYFGKQAARYTHNHKVFIGGRGFTPIYDVRVGDRILTAVPELSEIQQQVILGSLLGDGSLRLQKTQKAKNPLFSVAHSDKQKDYLEWKELILKNISMGVTVQKNNRGFNTRKDALLYKFFTKSLPCLHSLYDKFFKVGRKEVSLELLYGLTPIALAVWFMDDGSSHKNTLYLHTCGLSENSVENVVSYFRDKYGIFFKKRKRNNLYAGKVGFDLSVCQSKGGYKFMELVAPYIIPSMQYKIPKYFEGTVGGCLGEIGKQEFRESSYTTITAIIDAPFKKGEHKSKFVKYCMEVDGNHNFFTTMGLVSNSKFDTKFLNQAGIQVTNVTFDTMLASHLLDEESPHGLKDLANLYLDVCGYDEVIGDYDEEFHKIPIEDLGRYCAIDCDCTLRLKHIFEAELKKYDLLYKLFINLVMPFQDVIKDTEFIGVKVDRKYLEGLITTYRQRVLELNTRFTALVGRKINIASPKQLAELFYKEYKFEPTKKTEGGANSIDEEVLEGLAHKSEVAKVVLEYRKSVKTLNTFLEPMQSLLDTNDRLHTNYLLHGTATGRTSSASPNLQNIPNTKEIRKMFIADGGCKFLIVDYSQLELRILAKYSKDSRLVGAFVNGEDVHSTTASAIFGVPLAEVTKEQRSIAKSVNFGLVYGQGAEGLSHELGITKAEAQSHIDTFFLKFSSVRNWMDDYKKKAMELLYVENMFGRRRRIRPKAEISNKAKWGGDNKSMSLNDRQIINSPIQGCLVGTTHIYEKKQGYICLHDVVGKTIELWDGDRFVRGTVVFAGKKQEVVIKFKNGQSIVCSPDHKFLTIDVHGIETWKTPKEFRSLTLVRISKAVEGDKIFWNGIPNGTAEVANVTETESFVEMYDVVNTDSGKFMANGLIVHNSGGDLTSFASVVVAKRLKEAGLTGRMVLTVHDELVLEVKESEMEVTEKIVREVMTRPFGERTNSVMGGIPLEIGVDIEPHWI